MIITKKIPLPAICIKVGKHQHLKNFINNGEVYFNTFKYFRGDEKLDYQKKLNISLYNLESKNKSLDFFQQDPLEAVSSIEFSNAMNPLVNYTEDYSHAFCFYGLKHIISTDYKLPIELQNFGDHFTIFDPKIFFEALEKKLNKIGITKAIYDFVKFYEITPGKDIKNLTQFHKKSYFEYQSEYRILVNFREIGINDSISINIGKALKTTHKAKTNISPIYPSKDLDKIEIDIRPI